MGTTYFVANLAKRQYFDPSYAGGSENSKRSGVLYGLSGHALGQLLMPRNQLDFYLESWIGDGLVLVGDEGDPNDIEQLKLFQKAPDQDAYHIVTELFDDISLNLIAQLCKRTAFLNHFLDLAEECSWVFMNLAHAFMFLPARSIEFAFIARFGTDWRHRYNDILKSGPYYPMPMTPASQLARDIQTRRAAND